MPDREKLSDDITEHLRRWTGGDRQSLDTLVSLAYPDLRNIALGYLRHELREHTLQATSLVNELYLRLLQVNNAHLVDRSHFFTFAAQLMRFILVDYARKARALKRIDDRLRTPLHDEIPWVDASGDDMLALDEGLSELSRIDERKVKVLELRYFVGCTNEETAELLGISRSTVDRDIEFAKAWLYRRLTHPRF